MHRKRLTNTLSGRTNPVLISEPCMPSRIDSAIPQGYVHANILEFASAYVNQSDFGRFLLGKGIVLVRSGGIELPIYNRIDDKGTFLETDRDAFGRLPEWKRALCHGKGKILAVSVHEGAEGKYMAITTHCLSYVPARIAYVAGSGNSAVEHGIDHIKELSRK